jgi:ribonuclease G
MPTRRARRVSKRIGNEKERKRLREAIDSHRPPDRRLIVRTVAEGLTKKQLKADVGYLVKPWGEIVKKREGASGARRSSLRGARHRPRAARDMFGEDIEKIVIDDRRVHERLVRFIEMFMPERVKDDIELYTGEEPIFDAYGIEDEISRASRARCPLPRAVT